MVLTPGRPARLASPHLLTVPRHAPPVKAHRRDGPTVRLATLTREMPDGLKLGLFSMNMSTLSRPEPAARIAAHAESAGFDSLWCGEHVVLPDPRVPPSPMAPE